MECAYKIGSKEVFREANDNELRVTVYFPANCKYRCPFCTSKQLYSQYQANSVEVLSWVEAIGKSRISVVTITGGEPFSDMSLLEAMLKLLPGKKVYINSTLMAESVLGASDILTRYDNIAGISVSRHTPSWEEDVRVFFGKEYWKHSPQAHDKDIIDLPARSIRINAVLPSDPIVGAAAMPGVIRRWEAAFLQNQNIGLSFREDYNTVTLENLHALDTPYVCALTSMGLEFVGQSDCHVCDNLIFRSDKGMEVRYHRGLANTRLKVGSLVEIESLVLFPDGHMATDWDRSDDGLAAYCQACGLQNVL